MKPLAATFQFTTSLVLGWLASSFPASAQIAPDATLPNNSVVNIEGQVQRITGGTPTGGNLFHSFGEFNVRTGETAHFDNALTINNIISRVTGGQLSNINGLIRANGSANLFLINPNGIVFGPNAQLNIGGSFLASTANSLKFADGIEFSATNPQTPPLLTVNVPVGLQFGANPENIINRSQAIQISNDGTQTTVGLQVQPGRTIALVGGNVSLEGGYLTSAGGTIDLSQVGGTLIGSDGQPIQEQPTSGGRIEIGAVGANSQVQITQQANNPQILTLDYQNVDTFQDIQLFRLATVDASGDGGGDIQVQGRRITVSEGSQIRSNTLGANPGGTLVIRATESLEVLGNTLVNDLIDPRLAGAGIIIPRRTSVSTTSFASGRAGNLTVETGKVIVNLGAEIVAFSFGMGRGGDVLIRASESVALSGQAIPLGFAPESFVPFGFDVPGFGEASFRAAASGSSISASSAGPGDAGSVRIETGQLSIRDGAFVSTNPLFIGNGGTLTVIASDSVEVSGTSQFDIPPKNLGISRSLLWSAATGSGDARDLTLETRRLIIRDGGTVQATTFGTGDAGNVFINASESVEVSGSGFSPRDGVLPSNLSASTFDNGNAGSLRVNTGRLIVRNGGEIAVNSTKTGNAGNLEIVANSLRLEDGASINATTVSGLGGNLTLRTQDLQLRRGSRLITDAGNTDGGNITINTDTLVALENSDITANAITGRGGQVIINTQGIFGTQFRNNQTPASDITASSQLGASFSGTVTITTPDVDTNAGLVELTTEVPDATDQVVVGCAAASGNSFTVTGRGGLPEDPTATVRGQTLWQDGRDFSAGSSDHRRATLPSPPLASANAPDPIAEATSWVVNAQGKIELVATVPLRNSPNSGSKSLECNAQQR